MARTFPCNTCGKKYQVRKTNFSKNKNYISGFSNNCKKCCNEETKKWREKQTDEKKREMTLASKEFKSKARKDGRYSDTNKKYLARKRELQNASNLIKRNSIRLVSYVNNFYWEEKRDVILLDIDKMEW